MYSKSPLYRQHPFLQPFYLIAPMKLRGNTRGYTAAEGMPCSCFPIIPILLPKNHFDGTFESCQPVFTQPDSLTLFSGFLAHFFNITSDTWVLEIISTRILYRIPFHSCITTFSIPLQGLLRQAVDFLLQLGAIESMPAQCKGRPVPIPVLFVA